MDFGYDVSDYCAIDPKFGTLADFDRLIAEANRRGIRIVMDLVLNHTSDQHAWFRQARASLDNPTMTGICGVTGRARPPAQ